VAFVVVAVVLDAVAVKVRDGRRAVPQSGQGCRI
jgi:hypothetical protein